jgi:hypothetical protein
MRSVQDLIDRNNQLEREAEASRQKILSLETELAENAIFLKVARREDEKAKEEDKKERERAWEEAKKERERAREEAKKAAKFRERIGKLEKEIAERQSIEGKGKGKAKAETREGEASTGGEGGSRRSKTLSEAERGGDN